MIDLLRYFLVIFQDGDSGNDWLMHLPALIRPLVMHCGDALALALTLIGWA